MIKVDNSIGKVKNSKNILIEILLFVLLLVYVFIPFESTKFTYEWNPKLDGNKVRLTLLELNPAEFKIMLPCIALDNNKQWIFEAMGGPAFLFEADNKNIYLTTGVAQSSKIIQNTIPRFATNASCETLISYKSDQNQIKIINKNKEKIYELRNETAFYFSSYVKWNEKIDNDGFNLKVTTKTLHGTEKSVYKYIVLILILCLLFIKIRNNLVSDLKKIGRIRFRIRFEFNYYNVSALVVIILSAILVAPMSDDGLYLLESKVLNKTGDLLQYQYPVPFPTGHLHAWINSLTSIFDFGVFFARIIPSLILFIIWFLISRVIRLFGESHNRINLPLFIFWTLYVISFGMTLRPEPYVTLLFFCLILVVFNSRSIDLSNMFGASLLVTSLALSIHQSGLVILFASLPIWLKVLRNTKEMKLNFYKIYIFFILSILIFFYNSSFLLYFKRLESFERVNLWPQPFTGEFKWGYPPYLEYMRIIHLKFATPSQTLLVVTTIIVYLLILLLGIYNKNFLKQAIKYDTNIKLTYWMLISAPFGLLFAPSKWSGHYAALFPILIVGFILINYFSLYSKFLNFILIIGSTCSLIIPWKNGGSDTLNMVNIFRIQYFDTIKDIRFLIFLILSLSLLIIFIKKSYLLDKLFKNYLIFLIFLINPIFQLMPSFIDSFSRVPGWTFQRQLLNEIKFKNFDCGIYTIGDLSKTNIDFKQDKFVFTQESYVYFPCLQPILPEKGIWEFPSFSVGGIPVWDQQRLANEVIIEKIYCPNFLNRSFNDQIDRCIYKWESKIPDMKIIASEKILEF